MRIVYIRIEEEWPTKWDADAIVYLKDNGYKL